MRLKTVFTMLVIVSVVTFGLVACNGCASARRGVHPSAVADDLKTAVEAYNTANQAVHDVDKIVDIPKETWNGVIVPAGNTANDSLHYATQALRAWVQVKDLIEFTRGQLNSAQNEESRAELRGKLESLSLEYAEKGEEARVAAAKARADANGYSAAVQPFLKGE